MSKSLTDLKKSTKASELKPVETPAQEGSENAPKQSKRSFSDEELQKYLGILSDGKPHRIQDLLKEFGLPSTTSGREKLRAANRQINKSGTHTVVGLFPDGMEGKHFQLVENANGSKVAENVEVPAESK